MERKVEQSRDLCEIELNGQERGLCLGQEVDDVLDGLAEDHGGRREHVEELVEHVRKPHLSRVT